MGKEDWIAWVRGSELQRLRAFWNALYQSGGPQVKEVNTPTTRRDLREYLEERPDDWEFEFPEAVEEAEVAPTEEAEAAEAEPETEGAEPEEEAPAEEEAEAPEDIEDEVEEPVREEAVEMTEGWRRISWSHVLTSPISGIAVLLIFLVILSYMGVVTFSLPVSTEAAPTPTAITEASPTVQAAPSPTVKPEPSPTVKPEPAPEEVSQMAAVNNFGFGWNTTWYWSPFRDVTDTLADTATHETFAEPGVLLDDTAAFDYLSATETPINAPEGGFTYIAVGSINLVHDGYSLNLFPQDGNIYLIIVRGLPDDDTDLDLNQQVWANDYPRGFGIYSPMPYGAYVSLEWFIQQIENAQESQGDPNCGADGCDKITAVVVELQSHTFRMWEIFGNPRDWTRVVLD